MRNLCQRLRSFRHVLPPYPLASRAQVPTHPYEQCRGPMTERLVREFSHDGVPERCFRPAVAAPRVRLEDTTFQHRPLRIQMPFDGNRPSSSRWQNVVTAGSAKVGGGLPAGIVCVRTSILREASTRTSSPTRTTLVREEP